MQDSEKTTPHNAGTECSYDPGNPVSITRHLVAFKGQRDASLDEIAQLYAGEKNADLAETLTSHPEIAVTSEGRFVPMDIFCQGDIRDKIDSCTESAKSCDNAALKDKYLSQIAFLSGSAKTILPQDITFGLRQKWIPARYIGEFLLSQGFGVGGSCEGSSYEVYGSANAERHAKDFGAWMQSHSGKVGSYIVYGNTYFDHFPAQLENYLNGKTVRSSDAGQKIAYLARIEALEKQFEQWMQSHPDLEALVDLFNEKYHSYVAGSYDSGPLDIQDFLSGNITLHGYQNSEVRRLADEGRGICAFDVGLGKSCISLALAAWNYKRNTFGKTCIVVPNSVFITWYNEARRFFSPEFFHDNTYFVGLAKSAHGLPVVSFSKRHIMQEYERISRSKHPLVFMTREKFVALGIGEQLADNYAGNVSLFCPQIASPLKSLLEDEDSEMPLFKDLGFSSLHLDEAHAYKNCLEVSSRCKSIRYLSTPILAKTALNAAVKAFSIRAQNNGLGVYGFTATPLTNSPFEILNLISLVSSPKELLELNIKDLESLITLFGNVKIVPHVRISGKVEMQNGLVGFSNLDALRNFYSRFVHIKSNEEVGDFFSVVEPVEHEEFVSLDPDQFTFYEVLRKRAKSFDNNALSSSMEEAREQIFSIIRDMDRLTIDSDYFMRKVTYLCDHTHATRLADALSLLPEAWPIAEFSKEEKCWITKERPLTYRIVAAPGGMAAVALPQGIDVTLSKAFRDVGIPETAITHPVKPKYRRLLERLKEQYANGGKQLVFTEEKGQHPLLRRIISYELKIPLEEIGIINASETSGSRLDKLCAAYNRGIVRIIIANRKAELGINLQEGTTAIHHITLPWTPSSIKQRNGRGVRQGNTAERIDVYYYFGEKTFDSYRFKLLRIKANWIGEVLTGALPAMPNGDILSTEELLDLLADDPEAAARNREKRNAAARILEQKARERAMYMSLNQLACLHHTTAKKKSRLLTQAKNNQDNLAREERLLAKEGQKNSQPVLFDAQTDIARQDALLTDNENKRLVRIEEIKQKKREIADNLIEVEAAFIAKSQQLTSFLRRMADEGSLPFSASLIDKADRLTASPEGAIYQLEEIWESPVLSPDGSRYYQIREIDPEQRVLTIQALRPEGIGAGHNVPPSQIGRYRKLALSDYLLKEVWRYGLLPNAKILTREFFDQHGDWLSFDLQHGMVYRYEDVLHVAWSKQQRIPSRVTPVWPKPDDPEFRNAVFQRYHEEKYSPHFCPNLMIDLFGEDYDVVALASSESPEAEILRAMGNALEEAAQARLFEGISAEELLRKLKVFTAAQQGKSPANSDSTADTFGTVPHAKEKP